MKVYLGCAVGRTVEPEHALALSALLRDPQYIYQPQIGDSLMERTRGMSASNFLRNTDADIHLSLDSDIVGFQKAHIDLMCEQAMELGIVGGLYLTRSNTRTFPASQFNDGQSVEFAYDTTPVPIKWLATGCMAVHRRVFEKMAEGMPLLHAKEGKKAWYDFYETMHYEHNGELIKLSEDFSFCERARQHGFEPHINPAVRVGHRGPFTYRLEDMATKILTPQPIRLTHVDKFWRIECAGVEETPEAIGRLREGEAEVADKKFAELKK